MKTRNHDMPNETALITGATSGIGLELAREFARHKHPLIIIAPDATELRNVANRIQSESGVLVTAIPADLTDPEAPDVILDTIEDAGLTVDVLVNNAGVGQRGNFWEIPLEKDLEMIRLNIEAVIRLTKIFLPPMLSRGQGTILNTASIAGFEPGPLLAVYHASKAFVLSWSEALATELQDTGITVTALCPGPVDTDFFPKADMVETAAFQKANVMSPQEVAKIAHTAAMKGERVVIPGGMNKVMLTSRRLISESLQAKKNKKMYTNIAPEDHRREPGDIREETAARE